MITQAGALGDPYGSGVRTVWWVYGVGPVQIAFEHAGGETSSSQLASTTLTPRALPSDLDLMPLKPGTVGRFRWRNDKHMKKWSTQRFEVAAWPTTPRASTSATCLGRSTSGRATSSRTGSAA